MLTLVARPAAPRPPGRPDPLLALTAEALLGAQLVVRHRAPRVAVAIAAGVAVLVAGAGWAPAPAVRQLAFAVGLGSATAAVAGARLFAPGPALHSARYAATSSGRAVVGRVLGASGVLAAPVVALLLVLASHEVSAGVLASTLAAECAALAVTAAVVAMLGVMPGGVLCVAGALALAAWPDAVLSPAWLPVCGALAAGGALLARAAIRGRWR